MLIQPTTIVLTALLAILGRTGLSDAISVVQSPAPLSMMPELNPSACTPEDLGNKEFDVVVYGASGSIGQAIVEMLRSREFGGVKWAVAGRNPENMLSAFNHHNNAANLLRSLDSSGPPRNADNSRVGNRIGVDLAFADKLIVAPLTDSSELRRMAKRAKTIINCGGPYDNNGTAYMIHAALESCTHYVDLSTELFWQRQMLEEFNDIAKARGLAIVQSVGTALVDMVTMLAATDVVKYTNDVPTEVMFVWTKLNGQRTFGDLTSSQAAQEKHGPLNQPYILVPEVRTPMQTDVMMDGFASMGTDPGRLHGWDDRLKMQLLPSPLAPAECAVVRRSMSTKFKGKPIRVKEATSDRLLKHRETYQLILTRKDPQGGVRLRPPKPNYLPPHWERAAGSAAGFAVAFGQGRYNPSALVTTELHGDPSFTGVPRFAVEVAMALATSGGHHEGGYLTPFMAVPDLEDRMKKSYGGNFISTYHKQDPVFPIEY